MRLDIFLFENGYAHSRTFAKALVVEGKVTVDGNIITKPSFEISEASTVGVMCEESYVSRGAYKLEGAFAAFDVTAKNRSCIDIGASSGGFTDFLLRNGAARVICVDSGKDQLVPSIKTDARVTSYEGFNARYMTADDFEYTPDLAVMDVSFISATYIIPAVYDVLASKADFICLIKPQFEVGKSNVGKGGIVKDEKVRSSAVQKVTEFAKNIGFECKAIIKSPITGGDGNVEFLAHFVKS